MNHIEFFHKDHFEKNYHRVGAIPALSDFVDFFWETKFDHFWNDHPDGFSDILFPNIGYSYIVNLGTPVTMHLHDEEFEVRKNCFLPRHTSIECHHQAGAKLFGIKFKISPILFEKKINFAEYREYIFSLSYLLDEKIIGQVAAAENFKERVQRLTDYYLAIVKRNESSIYAVNIVREILSNCYSHNDFTTPIDDIAKKYGISTRTLQRYFEATTSLSTKKAIQIMRVRKATAHLAYTPANFHYSTYGYFDHSHFYKHLKQFLHKNTLKKLQPHLSLLAQLHKKNG